MSLPSDLFTLIYWADGMVTISGESCQCEVRFTSTSSGLAALTFELLVKGLLALMGYISYEPQSIPVKQHFHFLIKWGEIFILKCKEPYGVWQFIVITLLHVC